MAEPSAVSHAVIAAAGQATRMWPASKAVPKELFPVGKVPAICRLVTELADAGIRQVVLVVTPTGQDLMQTLFDASIAPPAKMADDPVVRHFQSTLAKVRVTFVLQDSRYGNAVPLMQAADIVNQNPCIYAFGDDVVIGENATKGLIQVHSETGYPVLAAQQVPTARKTQFGILECLPDDPFQRVSRLLEKPSMQDTSSNLASFGRYLVTPELLDGVRRLKPGRDGELWFTDLVKGRVEAGGPVCTFTLSAGRWYTVGDPQSYVEACVAAQKADEEAE